MLANGPLFRQKISKEADLAQIYMECNEQERSIARMRETVRRTQATYEQARKDFAMAVNLGEQNPDGAFAVTQASRREDQARDDFRKAVVEFTRLILDGKLPG